MRNVVSRGKFSYNLNELKASNPEAPPVEAPKVEVVQVQRPQAQPNRHMRRKNSAFNRLLMRRLKKEQLPVKLEILPDGGVHATVDMRENQEQPFTPASGDEDS